MNIESHATCVYFLLTAFFFQFQIVSKFLWVKKQSISRNFLNEKSTELDSVCILFSIQSNYFSLIIINFNNHVKIFINKRRKKIRLRTENQICTCTLHWAECPPPEICEYSIFTYLRFEILRAKNLEIVVAKSRQTKIYCFETAKLKRTNF